MEETKKVHVTDDQLKEFFPDLPKGRLDEYRSKASFDWRRIKLVYDDLDTIKTKNEIWSFMRQHPLFQHSSASLTLDEERHVATQRMYVIYNENFVPMEKIVQNPRVFTAETEALFMYDSSLAIKISLTFRMFANVIRGSGKPHHYHYVEDSEKGKIGGCFALTEVAHGSNAKGMRTTATFSPEKRQFILHSDDFEAAKCWVGSLGKCATHAVVYAMMVSKGKNHGLHAFVVPIRNPQTLQPYPGVVVGDLGEKIGLNGVDNGFVMFNKYHIPMEAQLDKLGGVDESGDYKTPFRDPNKRFGASLGILSGGRVQITSISTTYLQKAIVTAVRYSAVRRQFGPPNAKEETPVLEYPQQQVRLLPYLAATYAMRIFCNWFSYTHVTMTINNMLGTEDEETAAARGVELHALSSAAKPLCGWTARDGIQAAREACGGHGYLTASGIGSLRNDNDANCTYEGENSLLLQQTSNWLLSLWPTRATPPRAPYGSLAFLHGADRTLQQACSLDCAERLLEPQNLLQAYQWLTAYMLRTTYERVELLKKQGKDSFQAKNESQPYAAVTLSLVYGENFLLNHFYKSAESFEDPACRKVLLKMVSLYGAWMLEKHLATLYIGGYYRGAQGAWLREGVARASAGLLPEAVALADALAPPDWCLRSVLGAADGEAYKNIQNSVLTYPGAMSRPHWWRDVVYWESYAPSKL